MKAKANEAFPSPRFLVRITYNILMTLALVMLSDMGHAKSQEKYIYYINDFDLAQIIECLADDSISEQDADICFELLAERYPDVYYELIDSLQLDQAEYARRVDGMMLASNDAAKDCIEKCETFKVEAEVPIFGRFSGQYIHCIICGPFGEEAFAPGLSREKIMADCMMYGPC